MLSSVCSCSLLLRQALLFHAGLLHCPTGAKSDMLTARIDNSRAQQSVSRAVSQALDGCAAQDWGQVLTFPFWLTFGDADHCILQEDVVARVSLPSLLQGVKNTLAQERKCCLAIAHPFDELEFVHMA